MPAHASTGTYNTLVYRLGERSNWTEIQNTPHSHVSGKIQNPLHVYVFSLFQNFNPRSRLGPLLQ